MIGRNIPGMMETVLRARKTLKVLSPARFPISTKDVRYPAGRDVSYFTVDRDVLYTHL
jgi:hypothetical protein